jgi:hypothetical protein
VAKTRARAKRFHQEDNKISRRVSRKERIDQKALTRDSQGLVIGREDRTQRFFF